MAATMATMAILNAKCLATNTPKLATSTTKPMASSSSSKLLSIQNLPRGLASSAAAGAVFAALSASEPAFAAQQIAEIAAAAEGGSDNRGQLLLIVLTPAVLWVLYNILQPALNQLNRMRETKGVVVGLGGLTALAHLATAPEAEAAQAAAGGDNRGQLLLIVLTPAVLWVLYNILQPALNQLNRMRSE